MVNIFNSSYSFRPEIIYPNWSVFLGVPYYKNKRALYLSDSFGHDVRISNFLYGISTYYPFPSIPDHQFMETQSPFSFLIDPDVENNLFYGASSDRYNRYFSLFLLTLRYYQPKFGRSTHVQFLEPEWTFDKYFRVSQALRPKRYRFWGYINLGYRFRTRIKRWFVSRDLEKDRVLVNRELFSVKRTFYKFNRIGKGFHRYLSFNSTQYVRRARMTFPPLRSYEFWLDFIRLFTKDFVLERSVRDLSFTQFFILFEYLSLYGEAFENNPVFQDFWDSLTETLSIIFNYLCGRGGSFIKRSTHRVRDSLAVSLHNQINSLRGSFFWSYFSESNPGRIFSKIVGVNFKELDYSELFEEAFDSVYSRRFSHRSTFYNDFVKKKNRRDRFFPDSVSFHYSPLRMGQISWAPHLRLRNALTPVYRFNISKTFLR